MLAELGIEPAEMSRLDWVRHRWEKKLDGKSLDAGAFDFEIVVLDRFGVLPYEGALYDQDPLFVDELRQYIGAVAAHERKNRPKK